VPQKARSQKIGATENNVTEVPLKTGVTEIMNVTVDATENNVTEGRCHRKQCHRRQVPQKTMSQKVSATESRCHRDDECDRR
jgi:hypothetical protein